MNAYPRIKWATMGGSLLLAFLLGALVLGMMFNAGAQDAARVVRYENIMTLTVQTNATPEGVRFACIPYADLEQAPLAK